MVIYLMGKKLEIQFVFFAAIFLLPILFTLFYLFNRGWFVNRNGLVFVKVQTIGKPGPGKGSEGRVLYAGSQTKINLEVRAK